MRLAEVTGMEAIGQELIGFLDSLNRLGLSRNITTILTSDHGSIYDKGRFWYTYHPNEEVVNVPGVIFQAESIGVDDRLFYRHRFLAFLCRFFVLCSRLHRFGRSNLAA